MSAGHAALLSKNENFSIERLTTPVSCEKYLEELMSIFVCI